MVRFKKIVFCCFPDFPLNSNKQHLCLLQLWLRHDQCSFHKVWVRVRSEQWLSSCFSRKSRFPQRAAGWSSSEVQQAWRTQCQSPRSPDTTEEESSRLEEVSGLRASICAAHHRCCGRTNYESMLCCFLVSLTHLVILMSKLFFLFCCCVKYLKYFLSLNSYGQNCFSWVKHLHFIVKHFITSQCIWLRLHLTFILSDNAFF